jgi:hypothetical protein
MPETKASDPSTWAPTPTQAENDLAALGQHVDDKEHDGSPITDYGGDPQTNESQHKTRQVHAEQPARGGYQTRQARPAQQPQPSHPPPLAHPHSDDK